jgi:hypothetical protein
VDDQPRNVESGRLSRRDLIRRGAIVGGSLLWVAPAIQSLTPAAHAQTVGSPTFGCCECRTGGVAGSQNCSQGVAGLECTTVGSQQATGPASSEAACQQHCQALNKTYCFHSAPTQISCVPTPGGSGALQCSG